MIKKGLIDDSMSNQDMQEFFDDLELPEEIVGTQGVADEVVDPQVEEAVTNTLN